MHKSLGNQWIPKCTFSFWEPPDYQGVCCERARGRGQLSQPIAMLLFDLNKTLPFRPDDGIQISQACTDVSQLPRRLTGKPCCMYHRPNTRRALLRKVSPTPQCERGFYTTMPRPRDRRDAEPRERGNVNPRDRRDADLRDRRDADPRDRGDADPRDRRDADPRVHFAYNGR